MSSKPNLALLCGLLCDEFVWEDVARLLADVANVSIFSFAGCTTIAEMAEKVLAAMPANFAVAGHSMGGRVAIEIFNQEPSRLTHLALLNTGVHPRKDSEISGRQRLLDIARDRGMAAVADEWLPPMMGRLSLQNQALMDNLRNMILRHSEADFRGEIQALLNRPDAEEVLARINIPTLLVAADEDQWSPVAQHEAMQQRLRASHLAVIPDAGHMCIVETPEKIAHALKTLIVQ